MKELLRLRELTRQLREPGGCDWDRAQDFSSIRPHLLEEVYEVIHAIDSGDMENLCEELGDLLFIVHFYARMAEEAGHFELADVAQGVCDKLVRRHPHVFGETKVTSVDDIVNNWEAIKKSEKAAKGGSEQTDFESLFDHRFDFLPALMEAAKIQTKAARVGFDWQHTNEVVEKIREEVSELEAEIVEFKAGSPTTKKNATRLEEELGDILFSVVNLARHLKVNPELALRHSSRKFIVRFKNMERAVATTSRQLNELNSAELEELWLQAKSEESQDSAQKL